MRNLGDDATGRDVIDEGPLLPADSDDLRHGLRDQLCDLFVVQVRSGDDEGADCRVQDGFDLELIPANVLVLCEQDPTPLANNRQKFYVRPPGELVECFCVVAFGLKLERDSSAQAFINVEGWRPMLRWRCFRSGSLRGLLQGCVRSRRQFPQAIRPR